MRGFVCKPLIRGWFQATQFHRPFFEGRDQATPSSKDRPLGPRQGTRDRGTEKASFRPALRGERGGGGGVAACGQFAVHSSQFVVAGVRALGGGGPGWENWRAGLDGSAATRILGRSAMGFSRVFLHCASEGGNYRQIRGGILRRVLRGLRGRWAWGACGAAASGLFGCGSGGGWWRVGRLARPILG
jgi:hypothetical protein